MWFLTFFAGFLTTVLASLVVMPSFFSYLESAPSLDQAARYQALWSSSLLWEQLLIKAVGCLVLAVTVVGLRRTRTETSMLIGWCHTFLQTILIFGALGLALLVMSELFLIQIVEQNLSKAFSSTPSGMGWILALNVPMVLLFVANVTRVPEEEPETVLND